MSRAPSPASARFGAVLVVCRRDGVRTLQFRSANERTSGLVDVRDAVYDHRFADAVARRDDGMVLDLDRPRRGRLRLEGELIR